MLVDNAAVSRRGLDKALAELGTSISPALVRGSIELLAPLVARPDPQRHRVTRDVAYGSAERHRLDIFEPRDTRQPRPVLLYVHGGGFVSGDKGGEGAAHYGNVGVWAVDHAMVGVTMNYRLAPGAPWPAGSDDVGAAVGWLREHAGEHGGDPERIVLLGQSAGAVHVAGHLAAGGVGVAGAAMVSGLYDLPSLKRGKFEDAYYGTDSARLSEQSTLPGLLASEIPCLFTVSEHDPESFQLQAALLCAAWMANKGRWPRLVYLQRENHLSPALALGSHVGRLGPQLLAFLATLDDESISPRAG